MSRLFLIGYRGAGKTTVARLVADELGWAWCDADQVLESRFDKTIRQIFADEGEGGFRDKESLVLEELCGRDQLVIATGGGVILCPENRQTPAPPAIRPTGNAVRTSARIPGSDRGARGS